MSGAVSDMGGNLMLKVLVVTSTPSSLNALPVDVILSFFRPNYAV